MKIPIVIRNIVTLSVLTLLESVHLLFPIVLAGNFLYPIKYDPAVWNKYFPFLQSAIRPNNDFFYYHCWMVSALIIQAVLVWYCRHSLQDPSLLRRLRGYMLNETAFLFVLVFCVFKIVIWNDPSWARYLLYAVLAVSWALRIFWPEACKAVLVVRPYVGRLSAGRWTDILMALAIVILIYPVDTDSILARDFIYEHFHHFDGVIMAPGWAYLSGCILNVDVLCQYGLGMTIAITKLAQAMGGFTYEHVLWVYVYAGIVYFLTAYLLLRFWLGSFLLAAAGTFLSIKFQMFHPGVAPGIWGYLSATVVRYFFDLFFLFFILDHIRNQQHRSLWAANLCTGMALAYMPDTGAYQWIALCVYVGFLGWEQKKIALSVHLVVPLIVAFTVLWMIAGSVFWSPEFWQGASMQASLFLNGFGDLPIYTNLSEGNFFAFFMGLLIPLVYVFSLVLTGAQYALDRSRRENIFVVVLCIYGLGLYHYYICRSAPTSYHVVDIPFVFLLMFWARQILSQASAGLRRGVLVLIFTLALGGLMTNYFFTYYPNILNLSRYDWAKEKEFYRHYSNFDQDARMIQGLTDPSEKVAVIANFDVAILIEAKRKPLFYTFPLSSPDYKDTGEFANTCLFTVEHLKRALEDLQKISPRYVFVDPKFYRWQLPAGIYQGHTALTVLLNYLHANYEESGKQGQYLLALKRKGM